MAIVCSKAWWCMVNAKLVTSVGSGYTGSSVGTSGHQPVSVTGLLSVLSALWIDKYLFGDLHQGFPDSWATTSSDSTAVNTGARHWETLPPQNCVAAALKPRFKIININLIPRTANNFTTKTAVFFNWDI